MRSSAKFLNFVAMDNFIVSARKYRPATFETVVGQHHITGTLKNAIKNNQLAQAFLFCGPRGVGKTTCARILAKTINCTSLTAEQEACGECESCLSFQSGHSFNFHELDAASNNSVDDIRSLIEQVRIPPQGGKYKTYIIDEVHMLSASAFNAFLKTLEEPPSYAIFILATTEKHKILPTILSRCQIFDFNRIHVEDISEHLGRIAKRENILAEPDGLHIIAQKADGGLRDALSMFDQIVSYTNRNLTYKSVIENLNILDYDYYFKLTQLLVSSDISGALVLFDEILNNGFDGNNFINGLASHLRNLLVSKDPQTTKLLEVSENIKQKYISQGQALSASFILTALNLANQCDLNYKNSKNQRLQVELTLIKMCHIESVVRLSQPLAAHTDTDNAQIKKKTNLVIEEIKKVESVLEKTSVVPDSAVSKNVPAPATPAPPQNKIALKPSAGTSKASMLIPSLTDLESIASGDNDKEPKYLTGNDAEPFTFDQLLVHWKEYASLVKEKGKINVYTLLTCDDPVLDRPEEITVHVEHKIQEGLLHDEMIDLLNFLRPRLKNFNVTVKAKQIVRPVVNRLYTSTERYQYLVEKNPKLEDLRRMFNLDINS